jgi:hypothetical protein
MGLAHQLRCLQGEVMLITKSFYHRCWLDLGRRSVRLDLRCADIAIEIELRDS